MSKFIQSAITGLRRRWQRATATFLSVLGSVWLVTEVLTRVSPDTNKWLDDHGSAYLVFAGCSAIIGFLVAAYEARAVSFTIPNTDTTLILKFASIFDEAADWIIGVNEFFDSTLGNIVSANSLHGQIIAKLYNGNEANFRRDVDAALAGQQSQPVQRAEGQNRTIPARDDCRHRSRPSQDISRRDIQNRFGDASLQFNSAHPLGRIERCVQRGGQPWQRRPVGNAIDRQWPG